MSPDQLDKKKIACLETVSAFEYLESSIKDLGFNSKKLSIENVEVLNSMASEKYRQTISK
jgi:precorrin-6B methylase 2